MRSFSELVASISWSTAIRARDSSLCANFNLEIHDPALKFRLVMEFLQMHLRGEITRNSHAAWVQVQTPTAWLVIDIRQICRLDFLSLLLRKSKVNCNRFFAPTSLNSFFSQNPRHHQRFAMVLPNFLNHCVIHQDLVEHVDNQECFQEY